MTGPAPGAPATSARTGKEAADEPTPARRATARGEPDEHALVQLAAAAPERAVAAARRLLAEAREPAVRVVALRVLALAGKELGRVTEGLEHLREALRTASSADLGHAAAQVRMTMVGLLAAGGDLDGALAAADAAEPVLSGADAGRLAANRAFALARSGLMEEALRTARRALPGMRGGRDPAALAGLLSTIGLAQVFLGEPAAAESALTEAAVAADRAGLSHQAAMARGNLAFVASRRGDVPRALALYAVVEPDLTPERVAQCRFDRAETLIAAGLPAEARSLLAATLADVTERGYRADTADGRLLLARAELADGDPRSAARTARRARAEFVRQDRAGWPPLADHLVVRARWAAGDRSPAFLVTARTVADDLDRAGWAEPAADVRIVAALLSLESDRPAAARDLLGRVSPARWQGPVALRVAAWHATALERVLGGDRRGAAAAVRAGLSVVDRHAAALGCTELRVRAADLAADLADLGLRQARSGRELFTAEERRRAIVCRPAAPRPPADPGLAAALAELRRLGAEHTAATAAGHDAGRIEERRIRLEGEVRAMARTRTGTGAGSGPARRRIEDLTDTLGDRALVQFVRLGADLHAVTLVSGRCTRWSLGPYDQACQMVRLMRFDLRVLAHAGRASACAAAETGLAAAAARAERELIGPLRRALGDRDLVIAPTGDLHGLPWAVLPALAGRPVTVVPSAAAWLRASARAPSGGGWVGRTLPRGTVLVAGPDLRHADAEIAALARVRPDATVLTGSSARAGTVRRALDGAALAHVAAHGEFREDNALFSRLLLADGPLVGYDLEGMRRAPDIVVLSACEAGRAGAGEGVMGMVGVLLDLGASTVVASVAPVRDEAARDFMVAFHDLLAAGLPPARALAETNCTPGVLGFVCFGAG